MMKKVMILVFGLVMAIGLMGSSNGLAKEKKLAPATIKFWFPSEGEVNDKYFFSAAKEFEAKFPQINVELTKLPTSGTDITIKLNAAALSGDYPDLLSLYIASVPGRAAKGDLADLRPYLKKWPDKADLFPSSLSSCVYEKKQLGIGFYPAPVLLVYRTDYFQEAGLDPAQPPQTWEDIRKYAYKLVKKDASGRVIRAGMDIPAMNAGTFMYIFLRQGGSLVVNEKTGKPSCSDKGAVAAFNYMVSLKDQTIPFDGQKLTDYPFMKGNAAMSYINIAQLANLLRNNPSLQDKVAYAPVTKGVKQIAFCGNRVFAIGKTSKYKDQTWEFLKFMLSKNQMLKRAKELNIPVTRKSLESEYVTLNPKLNKVILDYARIGKPNPMAPWFTSFSKQLQVAYEEVYTGKKTAQQALKDVEKTMKKEIAAIIK
jgi:ABC-type glycerol-3-phosphate transport system substrate-binding protein